MKITSPAFGNHQPIPPEFTCDGQNINPPLNFYDIPHNTQSLVLLVEDPDAPAAKFTHWLVFNIPPSTYKVAEDEIPSGGIQAQNDSASAGYTGPCPPSGKHRYFFKLFALDTMLDAKLGSAKSDIQNRMSDHILASSELVGQYQRQ